MKYFMLGCVLFALLISCKKEPMIPPYFAEVYPKILDDINIECTESEEEYYIYAKINGQEFCHDEKKVGEFRFFVTNKFETTGSSVSTSTTNAGARNGLHLSLGKSIQHFNEHINIYFPDFNLDKQAQVHLDSLIVKKDHDIMGVEDVYVPAGSSNLEINTLETGGGFLDDFLVNIESIDQITGSGGIMFRISSIFGSQDGSYLRFNEVKKTVEADGTYYYMDIEFECNLYHWPQYGITGLWGEIREGRIIAKLKL